MKKSTKDDYLQSIYRVMFYIEQHYNDELTLETLSQIAGFSKYHFHRIFKSMVGESVSDYIRRVRLSSTTLKFKTNLNITQIAQTSGYETNASFSKAFKKHFGITPRAFSQNAKKRKGTNMLTPKIVEIESIDIFYVRKTGAYSTSADQAWNAIVAFAYDHNLSGKVKNRYGIAHDNPTVTESEKIRYDACLELNDDTIKPDGEVQCKQINGGRYAVFVHAGPYELLDHTYKNIGDWIIQSGITLRDEPQFQKYLDLDPREVAPNDLQTEIYLPIAE